jgi:hypothetical protein
MNAHDIACLRRALFLSSGGQSEPVLSPYTTDTGLPTPADWVAMVAMTYRTQRIALRQDYHRAMQESRLGDALVLTLVHQQLCEGATCLQRARIEPCEREPEPEREPEREPVRETPALPESRAELASPAALAPQPPTPTRDHWD